MDVVLRANGRITTWMALVATNGATVENTKENTKKIESMVMASINGPMVEYIWDIGTKVNNMD
jgi:hypothetical protein